MDRMLQFFAYEHLPPQLQEHSKPFAELAHLIVATLPSNPERTVALRKLLEAKDCAVRARLFKE
jgi:ferritin-like protein